ncbi:molybdenum ABC transporter ATP-binding protein [Amorphus sp. MBR-141]
MSGEDRLEVAVSQRLGAFVLDAAFSVPMEGVTALFGPSGSGKTTILRAIAGLVRVGGRIAVGAECWQDDRRRHFVKPHRRAVGYVFQEASLFPHLSVDGNLRFAAKRAGPGHGGDFDPIVDLLGLGPLLGRSPVALSGGERQRVAVGRALLSAPRLLLMDEPLSALDRATKQDILPYLERLSAERGIPIVYVTHDVSEVARMADRIVVLSSGSVAATGPVEEVFENFDLHLEQERAEAGVVLAARVVATDAVYKMTRLDLAGQTLSIPFSGLPDGREVRLRIRARDVSVSLTRPVGISVRNVLDATILRIVEDPETAFAEVQLAVGPARLRAQLTREAIGDLQLRDGMEVFALVKSVSFDQRTFAHTGSTD